MELFDDLGLFRDNVWGGFELRFIADSDEYTVKVVVTFIDWMFVNVLQTGVCLVSFLYCCFLPFRTVVLPARSQCCKYFPLRSLCPLLTSRQHSVFVKLCFPQRYRCYSYSPLHSPLPPFYLSSTEFLRRVARQVSML